MLPNGRGFAKVFLLIQRYTKENTFAKPMLGEVDFFCFASAKNDDTIKYK